MTAGGGNRTCYYVNSHKWVTIYHPWPNTLSRPFNCRVTSGHTFPSPIFKTMKAAAASHWQDSEGTRSNSCLNGNLKRQCYRDRKRGLTFRRKKILDVHAANMLLRPFREKVAVNNPRAIGISRSSTNVRGSKISIY